MSRKIVLICCFSLAYAGTLGTDSPAAAISYSSIRFGTPSIEKNTEPIENIATAFHPTQTTEERLNKIDEIPMTYKTNTAQPIKNFASPNNAQTAPTYTGAIIPQYVPSGSRVLNLAKPILASRNIPQSPSPEFNSVPSLLKTEGLSAYASFPIETSTLGVYSSPMKVMELSSSLVRDLPAQTFTYSGRPQVQQTERLLHVSLNSNQATKGSYSEAPVSHVSVSSAGTNYSW